jgi:hypothetical protein
LVTLLAVYSLRSRAGFVSHRPRSWDLPFGAFSSQKVTGRFRTNDTKDSQGDLRLFCPPNVNPLASFPM